MKVSAADTGGTYALMEDNLKREFALGPHLHRQHGSWARPWRGSRTSAASLLSPQQGEITRTCREWSEMGQQPTSRLPLSLGERRGDFVGLLDEELGDRTERAIVQCDNADGYRSYW